jgi:nucleoside-diphosphate-sugar epimerase
MQLIVWGAGELGGRVAAAWVLRGHAAVGLTRSAKRHEELRRCGVEPRLGAAPGLLSSEDALLLALPGHTNQQAAVEALAHTPRPARAVLISSTGYYGTPQGLVSEDTPRGDTAHAADVEATEVTFRNWAGAQGVILRLGGLYRRGRGPMSALRRRGTVPPGPPNRTLALIHYTDAATATLAALEHPSPAPIYVGVVPPCPTRQEFYLSACQALGLPEPTFDAPLAHPPATYDVTRMRRDLLACPVHPDWHEALEV